MSGLEVVWGGRGMDGWMDAWLSSRSIVFIKGLRMAINGQLLGLSAHDRIEVLRYPSMGGISRFVLRSLSRFQKVLA